jgi:hypothetical protein
MKNVGLGWVLMRPSKMTFSQKISSSGRFFKIPVFQLPDSRHIGDYYNSRMSSFTMAAIAGTYIQFTKLKR